MLNIRRGGLFYTLFPNQENGGYSNKLTIVLDVEGNSAIVVPCTTEITQEYRYTKFIQVLQNSAEGIAMNLTADSMIMIDRLDPMPFNIFMNKHQGTVPESLLLKIEQMLED